MQLKRSISMLFIFSILLLSSACMIFKSNIENARDAIKNKDYEMALYHYRMELFHMENLDKTKDPYVYDEFAVFCDMLGNNVNEKFYYEAIKNYTKAIELNDKVSGFYINRSYPYDKLGMYKEALQDSNKAIELDSTDVIAYYNRAHAYMQMQQNKDAILDFDKAISMCNTEKCLELVENSYVNKASIYINENKFDEAIIILEKAKALDKNDALIYINLAIIHLKKEDCKNAIQNFKQAAIIDPVYNSRVDMAYKHCQPKDITVNNNLSL